MNRLPPKKFIAEPFSYHQEIELDIQSLTNEGRGIGRYNNWTVMVPFVIPGEKVRVRIYRNHKNYSEADLVEVLKPSSQRIQPKCPLFGQCGGCQYQHISYEEQLHWKQQHVIDCMERIGKLQVKVNPVIPSEKTYAYRTKLTPHFERKGTSYCPIGFLENGSRKIVDVPQCPIASEAINTQLPEVRKEVQHSNQRNGTLLLREDTKGIQTDFNAVCEAIVQNLRFQFIAGSFFQNNPYILNAILDFLKNYLREKPEIKYLIDAYCGVGVFGISLANQVEKFLGIEIDEKAITLAQKNMIENQLTNGAFVTGDATTIFKDVNVSADLSLVIMDPPRKGCSEDFLQQLITYNPKVIVYISCAPDTQARDLNRLLTLAPHYTCKFVQPFDMFPQTKHMECVAILER